MSATAVTALGSVFVYVYAGMQLVAGIAADRYGGRRTLLLGSVVMCAGAIMFPCARSGTMLFASRALIGFGSSFVYLSIVKEVDTLFAARHFAGLLGLTLLASYAGNIAATLPFERAVRAVWLAPNAAGSGGPVVAGDGRGLDRASPLDAGRHRPPAHSTRAVVGRAAQLAQPRAAGLRHDQLPRHVRDPGYPGQEVPRGCGGIEFGWRGHLPVGHGHCLRDAPRDAADLRCDSPASVVNRSSSSPWGRSCCPPALMLVAVLVTAPGWVFLVSYILLALSIMGSPASWQR